MPALETSGGLHIHAHVAGDRVWLVARDQTDTTGGYLYTDELDVLIGLLTQERDKAREATRQLCGHCDAMAPMASCTCPGGFDLTRV